jgi:hypothetical protein
LQADAHRERRAVRDVATREPDADGHAFRKVVQCDRDDEEPDPRDSIAGGTFAAEHEVLMRYEPVDREEAASAREHAHPDERDAERRARGDLVRLGEGGREQREESRGQHHAGGRAEHAVLRAIAGLGQQQDAERAQAGTEAGEEAA